MVRKVRASETIGGVTLEQYAKVKARLDVEATRAKPRSLAEILDEVGLDEDCWEEASASWSEKVNDDSAARLRQGWLSKRFPPPIAYGVAYAVAVERELSALAVALPRGDEPSASEDAAEAAGPALLADTLPRPGDRIGAPVTRGNAEGERAEAPAAEESEPRVDDAASDDDAPTTKDRARGRPALDRSPSLADPPRPFRLPERPPSGWNGAADASAAVSGSAEGTHLEVATRTPQAPAVRGAELGRLDPDGATIVGGSPLDGEALPFKPASPMPRLDPDGDTVTGVAPAPAPPLPFSPPAPERDESEDPEGTRETIPPIPSPAASPPRLDPAQRLDPDGATVLGAELREDPPLPFDRGPKRS